jgi:hypothetical protein
MNVVAVVAAVATEAVADNIVVRRRMFVLYQSYNPHFYLFDLSNNHFFIK